MSREPRPDVELTPSEWKVMDAVWARDPSTVRDVHDALGDATGWAYTTVKTLMERLVAKGALAVRREGKQGVFAARLPRPRARLEAARELVRRAFGGATAPLLHALVSAERLSASERRELARLLEEQERAEGRREGKKP